MRIYNDHPDIDAGDLRDRRDAPPTGSLRKKLFTVTALVLAPLLLLLFVLGSLPDLRPEDIVRMDGYAGRPEAPPVADFKVASQPVAETSPQTRQLVEVPISGLPLVSATAESEEPVQKIELREIAAVQEIIEKEPPVETFDASEGVVVELVSLQVKTQYSNVRSGPSTDNRILTSLSTGAVVSVFGRDGDWLEVGLNDGSAITGYMHKSLLGVISD